MNWKGGADLSGVGAAAVVSGLVDHSFRDAGGRFAVVSGRAGDGEGMDVVGDGGPGGLPLTLWGKFSARLGLAYPLLFHLLDSAVVAGELWDRMLSPAQRVVIAQGLGLGEAAARAVAMLAAGLHDLGKATRFQACEPGAWALVSERFKRDVGSWRVMRHERASMHVGLHVLGSWGYRLEGNDSPAVRIAQVLGGHHGRFLQLDVRGAAGWERVEHELGGPLWQETRLRYAWQVRRLTGAREVPSRVPVEVAVLLEGLVQLADRLVSQPHVWMPRALVPRGGALDHWMAARSPSPDAPDGWAAQVVSEAGLESVELPPRPFTEIHAGVHEPSVVQASVMEKLPGRVMQDGAGILVVGDGTGTGKSAVAWEAANIFNRHTGTRGCTLLQPTTAIADAAYDAMISMVSAHRPDRAPVALVHSHPWLSAAYLDARLARADRQVTVDEYCDDDRDGDGGVEQSGRPERKVTVPAAFLAGFDRALLAPFVVATLDQALMAVLHTRHAALRMLALSGRTVIIDEAHAHSAYMRGLLCRLVHWLAATGSSVIVLSATLRDQDARRLVHAYLTGAGHPPAELAGRDWSVPYPGWLFVPARRPAPLRMSDRERQLHSAATRRTFRARLVPVAYPAGAAEPGHGLREMTARLLRCVEQDGGCAVVSEATVEEAQATFQHLKNALRWQDARREVVLLHARLPGHQREALIRRLRTELGPRGPRPHRLVVVTTSLLDMSLDLDADVMISHLAVMETLLQRAGRLWRFEQRWEQGTRPRPRPPWAHAPLLHVLTPVDEQTLVVPGSWGRADEDYLLRATAAHLDALTAPTGPSSPAEGAPAARARTFGQIILPDHVPALLDAVHAAPAPDAGAPRYDAAGHAAHLARQQYLAELARTQLIPAPLRTGSLADLTRRHVHAGQAPTRETLPPARLLPCYRQNTGDLTLDPAGRVPLPCGSALRPPQVRSILERTVPAPWEWVAQGHPPPVPDGWRTHPLLADLVLLTARMPEALPVRFGTHLLSMDAELGLIHRTGPSG
ncbi:CRISPR-associated endonuclease Cas3'' [Streptomyces cyaneofuscatus]|uniref:CRISPR-associated endonuclease Cas3'' n=1 Tax=Streptomyces cyaneofuscatus TaxID=66883 RepID=UPI003681442D